MEELLWVLAGLVALLAATGWACQRLRLPPALGYLLVGVGIPKDVADARLQDLVHLEEASRIAVLVLLFFIGLELELRTLRKVLRDTRVVSVFNIVVPALAVGGLARLLGWSLVESLVLGIALSLSSTVFGERLSAGAGFPAHARARMFGVLLAEDVAAGALLAILAVLADGQAGAAGSSGWIDPLLTIGLLVVALVVLASLALLAVPRLLDRVAAMHSPELVILAAGAFLLLFSAAGDWAGSAELGAFLAGMAAAEAGSRFVVRNALTGLRHISLALFFFASGLLVEPALVLSQLPLILACVVLVAAAKLVVHVPSSMGAGLGLGDALRVGVGMATVGEFSLILVGAAQAGGIAHPTLPATVTGTIVGLLVLAPLLMLAVPALQRGLQRLPEPAERPLLTFVQTLRRRRTGTRTSLGRGRHVAFLVSALILVVAVGALAVLGNAWAAERLPRLDPVLRGTAIFGAACAVAAPLLVHAFRSYRRILHAFLRIQGRPRREDALKVRVADALVLVAAAVLGSFLALLLGASWPVALGALFVSVIIAALAWSRLVRLTGTLQRSLARVLGEDQETPTLLDQALKQYGWDVDAVAVNIPPASGVHGRTLGESRLAEATGATVAVLKRGRTEIVKPNASQVLRAGDTVVLLGDARQLARAEAFLGAGEAPMRMAAESRAATVVDLAIEPEAQILQHPRSKSQVEGETGVLILGLWRLGDAHPSPWDEGPAPKTGDRVLLLGSPLQAERLGRLLQAPIFEVEDVREAQPYPPA